MDIPNPLYLPGNIYHGYCSHDYNDEMSTICTALDKDYLLEIEKRSADSIILRTTYSIRNTSVGDLIAIKGKPDGIIDLYAIREIFYGNQIYWSGARPFTPNSKVFFITYVLEQDQLLSVWKGFIE